MSSCVGQLKKEKRGRRRDLRSGCLPWSGDKDTMFSSWRPGGQEKEKKKKVTDSGSRRAYRRKGTEVSESLRLTFEVVGEKKKRTVDESTGSYLLAESGRANDNRGRVLRLAGIRGRRERDRSLDRRNTRMEGSKKANLFPVASRSTRGREKKKKRLEGETPRSPRGLFRKGRSKK